MKSIASLALAVVATAASFSASAQFAKPEDAIKYRQSAMFVMQQNFGRVAGMAAGRVPFDAKVATDSADVAAYMIQLPWAGFGAGTEGGKAKPEIWKDQAKFKEYQDKVVAEMAKLATAAKSGSLDNIKAAVGPVGAACKACHDSFRN